MNNHIHEIELNVSNACLANCIFCSRPHGVGNIPFMEPETFNILVEHLKDVKFDIIQTSGNGETFLNPYYLDYIWALKYDFPDVPRWIYNNFSLITKERAEIIVKARLFSKIHVRIDSLQKWILERNSNLNFDIVMNNLKYFMSINTTTPLVILYNDINVYYDRCKKVLDKRPVRDYYTDEELAKVPDEFGDIEKFFRPLAKSEISFCKINPCLWGERRQAPRNGTTPCPKINVIEKVIWILPNGDCTACCYDDEQNAFIVGNIRDRHLLEIFYGEKRRQIIENIKNRVYKDYPCTNPLCCSFGDGIEAK